MYSKKILEQLKKKKIDIGDTITVKTKDYTYEGLLMPRPTLGDSDVLVLKLNTGYNVGITAESFELVATTSAKVETEQTEEPKKKGDIAILGCGGTIASRVEYKTGAVYPSITPKELRTTFPELEKWPIHSKQVFSLFSDDMNAHHWKLIADEIEQEIKDGSAGVVIMHGTDTLTYTSSAVSFMLQNLPVPVIFVGSQRSSDRPSSENKMNLINSVFSATKNFGEVAVCMHASTNDDFCYLHRGTKVRKMHTSRRDAFESINTKPMFAVDYRTKKFEELSEHKKRNKGDLISKKKLNDNVALVYVHPSIKPEFISKLDSYDGVVLMGTGLGHVPTGVFEAKNVKGIYKPIKELIASDIPVVMSSQCITGRVCLRVYSNGRLLKEAGVIGDDADWTPETAFTKLCWALGQTKKMDEVRKLMETNIAGELTSRSILE
ncbi:Glu-tRNA(Gln) amidotransferase subunit GatD [Candidatus Micrarchaeota archaeon]|nr:Glu-tRNA(Gln) amidotransferase subunit GatD [Candidatus Micrarchaeota archaeon]MBU1681955.1 Glu-tRNA(Gln) amidotransferase subunit GatD [Candidatus Micrarchaeota archaeon]